MAGLARASRLTATRAKPVVGAAVTFFKIERMAGIAESSCRSPANRRMQQRRGYAAFDREVFGPGPETRDREAAVATRVCWVRA